MNQSTRMTIGVVLAAMLAACSQSKPPSEPEVAQAEDSMPAADSMPAPPPVTEEPMPAPTTPATGSMVVYACDDGSGVTVTYDKHTALVKLPSGSTTLSRADAASRGGEEAYLGEELSLYRNGNSVRLENAGKSHVCASR